MRIVVTGGAGYIGSHTARALARQGHHIVVYDNLSTGHRFLADGFDFVLGDVGDRDKLKPVLGGMDAVLHFAAHAAAGESVVDPRKYFENNVMNGITLLNAVVEAKIPYFIHSSSCSVYGIPSRIPIPENVPRIPISPYGSSKLMFELMLEAYSRAYDLRYVNLRYFNAAGAEESGEIGELHDPELHLIPRALAAAAGKSDEFGIYGNEYPTPDGTCVRDYVHVSDLAEAHSLALNYLVDGRESVSLNVGTGNGYSVLEVLLMVEAVTGCPVPRRVLPPRPGDPPMLVADSQSAQRLLAWKPSRLLEGIVSSAWKWKQVAGSIVQPRLSGTARERIS